MPVQLVNLSISLKIPYLGDALAISDCYLRPHLVPCDACDRAWVYIAETDDFVIVAVPHIQ